MERDVIGELSRSLPLSRRRKHDIARELQAHLVEAQRDLEDAGLSREDAARESARRLGDPNEIAAGFERVYQRPRRTTIGLAIGLATAVLLGMYGAGSTMASGQSVHAHASHHHVQVLRP